MDPRQVLVVFLLAAVLLCARCRSEGIAPETMEHIRQAHARMLAVDGCVDAIKGLGLLSQFEAGGIDAAFFAVSVPQDAAVLGSPGTARAAAEEAIRRVKRMAEAQPKLFGFARSPEDAYRFEKEGRHAAYIGLGSSDAIGTDLSLVSAFYEQGVRCLTLSGGSDNAICDSDFDQGSRVDRGLSAFGRKVVVECNRLGMIIDLAGCSEKSFFDALAVSQAPVIVSQAAARTLCSRPENLTDEMIRAVAVGGGVVMVTFVPGRLVAHRRASRVTTSDIADHIDHMKRVAGIEAVGIGSGFGEGGGVSDCRGPGDALNLTIELLRRSYSETAVEHVWGGNTMRVFERAGTTGGER